MSEEAIESHMKSTPAENRPDPSLGKKKPKTVKPFAAKLKDPSPEGDGIPSATIRAWAGVGLVGLFVAWTTIGTSWLS